MAMYEVGIERFDELPRIVEHLKLLHLALMGDTAPFELYGVYERYIQGELEMSEDEAADRIKFQQNLGLLPDTDTLLADRTEAVDAYRLATLMDVAPHKLALVSAAEYDLWLPNAMELILPAGSERHSAEVCLRTNGLDEVTCESGECPVKHIRRQAEEAREPDFGSLEYKLFSDKKCRGVHTLLTSARDKGIITPVERNNFARQYMHQYNEAFPVTTRRF